MTSPILGEFVGTLILILLGDGVVAAVLLKRSKAEASEACGMRADQAARIRDNSNVGAEIAAKLPKAGRV